VIGVGPTRVDHHPIVDEQLPDIAVDLRLPYVGLGRVLGPFQASQLHRPIQQNVLLRIGADDDGPVRGAVEALQMDLFVVAPSAQVQRVARLER